MVNTDAPLVSAPLPENLAAPARAGRALVMGVVNVTPDSFSDGGRWATTELAVAHGRQLIAQGADLLDVRGESTRPGARRVDPAEEQERVLPVIRELAGSGVVVSVDTIHAATAAAAIEAGAIIVNDVWRLQPGRRQVAQQPRRLRPEQRRRAHRLLQARL